MAKWHVAICAVALLALGATAPRAEEPAAPSCPRESRAEVLEILASPPAQRVLAELRGADAARFLEALGAPTPVPPEINVLVVDIPSDPSRVGAIVFAGDCSLLAFALPRAQLDQLLSRVRADSA